MTEMREALVDINKATLDELSTISGIGESLAKRIIDNRPYEELHDLVRVSGISDVKLTSLLPYITLGKEAQDDARPVRPATLPKSEDEKPIAKFGHTEAFVFLEDRNERQDALLIIFGGFIIGLIFLLLRRSGR